MYRTIADFTRDWKYESGMTRKILDTLTDASLDQAVRPGGRTLGRIAWHVILTLVELPGDAGVIIDGPGHGDSIPATAGALAERYSQLAERVAATFSAQWTDEALNEKIPMYGETWKKGQVLRALINHEAHHRGQMTVLMRQAGLTVPGVYGPAEEEWAAMGLPPQA